MRVSGFLRAVALAQLIATSAVSGAALAAGPEPLTILRVTPTGEDVPAERQIVFQFNRPVVPIGRMEREAAEIPVTMSPALSCQWRWLNTSALACNLGEKDALVSATTYSITMAPGIKAQDGGTLASPYSHRFVTERPDVRYAWFSEWLSPSTPQIRVTFNQSVTVDSVREHLFFAAAAKPGEEAPRWGVEVKPDPNDRDEPAYLPVPGTKGGLFTGWFSSRKSDDDARSVDGVEARRVWIVTPEEELPADSDVSLSLEPGLVSALGPERGAQTKEVVRFRTFPELAFLGVKCSTLAGGDRILIKPEDTTSAAACDPQRGTALAFSAPVDREQVRHQVTFSPDLAGGRKDFDPWEGGGYSPDRSQPHEEGRTYDVWLPGGLKAARRYMIESKPVERHFWQVFGTYPETDLRDVFDRPLMTGLHMSFATDHRRPNFEIVYNEAVLEGQIDSEAPLYVQNLKTATLRYRAMTAGGEKTAEQVYTPPEVTDLQFAVPFDVRKMLGGKSGALYGTLSTDPVVTDKGDSQRRLFAVVTPWQMHVKLGHFNTLVWVTDMASGAPVKGARVRIYTDALPVLDADPVVQAEAVTDADGLAMLPGTESLDPKLTLANAWEDSSPKLFVRVDLDGEIGLMPLNGAFRMGSYRSVGESVYPYQRRRFGHLRSWGTTAQGVYRTGDTIQYKLYVRDQDVRSLVPSEAGTYTLTILDPSGTVVQKIEKLTLNAVGAYSGEFVVPKTGAVGWYQFKLSPDYVIPGAYDSGIELYPMRVLVSDFTPSPFRVTNSLNGDVFEAGQDVTVSSAAKLHSGGAYTDAAIRVTARLETGNFSPKTPVTRDFAFDSSGEGAEDQEIVQKQDRLNDRGEHTLSFALPQTPIYYGSVTVESAVQDDRGKSVATESRADYAGVDRFVGLKMPGWFFEAKKPASLFSVVVDKSGAAVDKVPVDITIEHQVTKAARVKGAGNAFLTEYSESWETAFSCKSVSTKAANTCRFTPTASGSYRALASIKDSKGRPHTTRIWFYVTGDDYVLWTEPDDYALEIIPEKTTYAVGDTARYLIKNPFPGAKALVTIERYGVIDRFVQTLEGSTPTISFPVKPDYLPGYYLSVVVVSPRVDKPVKDQVDLGKPTLRSGRVTVPVTDPYKDMSITAKVDRDVYRPRDTVTLSLHAEPRMKDKGASEPIEFAVAVLDESVFDLIADGRDYFDPYKGLYGLESLDVEDYSLLTRLVGRQKFEKKGANPGGDGGSDFGMRDVFRFVSYWNPSIMADASGNAEVSFTLPDNLTGWRVLVLAVTPTDRVGLGETTFKVNQPTELRPVMPNQVTEGDVFTAGFSVMNRTDAPRTLSVTMSAEGDVLGEGAELRKTETVTLDPYKRKTVTMSVRSKAVQETRDRTEGHVVFRAVAEDASDGDALTHEVVVHKRRGLEVAANYGSTDEDRVEEPVLFPKDIHTDVGAVSVVASPSVIGNVAGAFKYMRDYPYLCWEQVLSKGVMAAHYTELKGYLPADLTWDEAKDLPQQALDAAVGYQAPNGGMSYFLPQDEYADPYLSAYTALAFTWLRRDGYTVPEAVETKLHAYLDNYLRNDVFPSFYDKGMASTVRAVALAALAESGDITAADLERYRPRVPEMSLFGQAHFLQAVEAVPGASAMAKDVANGILSHANQSGGKFTFSETLDDSYMRLLSSPLRENCAILASFTRYAGRDEGKSLVGDVPFKLVRMITQGRGSRDYWENTQENMFCMNALIEYARVYEAVKPKMTVTATMDGASFGSGDFHDWKDAPLTFTRPIAPEDPGKAATVTISRKGDGRLYYATRLAYAPREDKASAVDAGIEIRREYSVERDRKWTLLTSPMAIRQGELVRVDLFLSLPAARNFVVVDDPVPGGLEPVNRDLKTASRVDADKGEFLAAAGSWWLQYDDWISYNVSRWSFYHQELRHNAARFFSDYLPAGRYHLSYTAQAVAPGQFSVMPVFAGEMYDPDVYGKGVPAQLVVSPLEGDKTP